MRIIDEVFADTSYWQALINTEDYLHEIASQWGEWLRANHIPLITSEMVFVEVMNAVSKSGSHVRSFAAALPEMCENQGTIVIPQTPDQFELAREMYAHRQDKSWSVTDCASFLTMESRNISAALTYDHHFNQVGFSALLRKKPPR